MSLQTLYYALLLDEQRKHLTPEEREKLREEIRNQSKTVVKQLMDAIEKSIDVINETEK